MYLDTEDELVPPFFGLLLERLELPVEELVPLPDELAVWVGGLDELGGRVAHLLYDSTIGVHLQL